MEKEAKYLQDISEIKEMMQRSSRFISLSGLSGIMAGIYALVGAYIAYHWLYEKAQGVTYKIMPAEKAPELVLLASGILTITLLTIILLTRRQAIQQNLSSWDYQAKRLLINLLIPLVAGGTLGLILIAKGYLVLVVPLTLLFYGLALVNASKYTLDETRSLGILEILLGLVAVFWLGYGLLFWAIGFGLLHIAYGIRMYLKYEK